MRGPERKREKWEDPDGFSKSHRNVKVTFSKLVETAIKPIEVSGCVYHVHGLQSFRIEPFERQTIHTGIRLELPKPQPLIIADKLHEIHIFAKIIPDEGLFIRRGLFCFPKIIDYFWEGDITIEMMNMTFPDFLLFKDKSSLAKSAMFGSTNSVRLERDVPLAKMIICEETRIKIED